MLGVVGDIAILVMSPPPSPPSPSVSVLTRRVAEGSRSADTFLGIVQASPGSVNNL